MGAARYEVLSSLPPGAASRTRLAWQVGDGGFRRPVVMREISEGAEPGAPGPSQEGVLPLLDLVELEGKRWAIYDFIPGATFAEVSEAHFAVERLPSLGLIARVIVDACRAIHRVHVRVDPLGLSEPLTHGGLSDRSVLVGFDGIARVLDLNARREGPFLAPELSRGDALDARADVFSLGALLHHGTTRFDKGYSETMARAPSPSEFPAPSAIHPEASPALDAVVMRALMPSPGSRFASAQQLAEELEKVLGPVLFTHAQVSEVLLPLFGERMAALKELVDPKKRPPAPRASAPRPAAAPRASAPQPAPRPSVGTRKTGSALDAMSAFDVKLDGEAIDDIDDLPTQANISLPVGMFKPGAPVPDFDPHATTPGKALAVDTPFDKPDFDPHATTPGRSLAEVAPRLARAQTSGTDPELPMAPSKPSRPTGSRRSVQGEAERARAKGQEKISTADLDPDQLSPELRALQSAFDDAEITDEPTNVRPRASQTAIAALQTTPKAPVVDDPEEEADDFDDPKKKESTMDVDRPEPISQSSALPQPLGRVAKVALGLLAFVVVASGAFVALNLEAIRARLQTPAAPATYVEEAAIEEVPVALEDAGIPGTDAVPGVVAAADAGEFEDEGDGDGGEEEDELVGLNGADAGLQHDGGAAKQPAPAQKKKKKKRSR